MSSLLLKIKACNSCNCDEILFSETTGVYDELTNPGGYGSPNIEIANASTAVLTIIRGDEESFDINLYNGTFPSSNTDFEYPISNSDFGYTDGDVIPDQILQLTYIITGIDGKDNPFTYNATIYKALTCTSKCCVLSMLKDIDWCCDDCTKKSLDEWLQAWALYQGMLASANCGDITAFNKQLALLNKICQNSNCGCN